MVILEGAVLGGGLGWHVFLMLPLAVIMRSLVLPETGLGVIPAQIAPFCGETY